jgi:N-acetylneuraminic acid mutarotase
MREEGFTGASVYRINAGLERLAAKLFFCSFLFIIPSGLIAQTWATLETRGEVSARKENGFMSCKGRFYLMGGYGLEPVNVFDPRTGEWTQGAAPPVEMHHFQAVRHGDLIYVVGALTGSYPNERPLEHIYIYDTFNDTWTKGDPIPEDRQRGSAGVTMYRGKIYIIGGTRDRYTGQSTAMVDRYDPRTGKWKKLSDAPHTRDYFHVATINGKIYAAGGRNTKALGEAAANHNITRVDVFDIESGRWNTLAPEQDLPTPRAGCTAVAVLDHLLVIGGESKKGDSALRVVEAYNTETGEWTEWGKLKQGRFGTQAFMCVGTVFIASGVEKRNEGEALATTEILIF